MTQLSEKLGGVERWVSMLLGVGSALRAFPRRSAWTVSSPSASLVEDRPAHVGGPREAERRVCEVG
jgi:hypothetical protein